MSHWYQGTPLPSVAALLDDVGEWDGSRVCGCCGNRKMFAIRYADAANDRFFACQHCDRTEGKA